jgi:flagellar biosynthesis/type III secretory pathway protein FliH
MSSSPSTTDAAFDFEQLAPPPRQERPPSLNEAAERARGIIAQAEADAERIRDHARMAGHREGFEAGHGEARTAMEPAAAALSDAITALRDQQERGAEVLEHEAVSLAMEIAEKVVAAAIEVQPERVLDVVRGALRAIVERERITILVNPEDLDLVRAATSELGGSLGGFEHIDVQEERRVQRGGALVRTSVGEIDARIQTKLDRAREAVTGELAS